MDGLIQRMNADRERRHLSHEERGVWSAVLLRALRDAIGDGTRSEAESRALVKDTGYSSGIAWIESDACLCICDSLGLDHARFVRHAKNLCTEYAKKKTGRHKDIDHFLKMHVTDKLLGRWMSRLQFDAHIGGSASSKKRIRRRLVEDGRGDEMPETHEEHRQAMKAMNAKLSEYLRSKGEKNLMLPYRDNFERATSERNACKRKQRKQTEQIAEFFSGE